MDKAILLQIIFLGVLFQVGVCFDPISLATGAAIAVSSVAIGGLTFVRCRVYECCNSRWINTNMTGLASKLEEHLYGQHLAINTVTKHLSAHLRNANPSKALVLSFQGWTGTGKNYVSQIIAKHMFKEGMKSKYVHLISATREFPHAERLTDYKDTLKQWIEGNITACERSLFIFDEMDKLPDGLLDVIKPYLEYYEDISGVVYRKSVFILLRTVEANFLFTFASNTAGKEISRLALDHWHTAKPREDLQLKDMERTVTTATVNQKKGLWHSELITKNLITAFVPFLPLERKHVKECIIDDFIAKKYLQRRQDANKYTDLINQVLDELTFYPNDELIYSTTGCKRVSEKVDLVMEDV